MATVLPLKDPWPAYAIICSTYCIVLEKFFLHQMWTYVSKTISSSFGSNQAATPAAALASENTLPLVLLGTVSTKEPSNLTARDTDVAGWDISISANVLV